MNQATCIFCKSSTNSFTTREHILPESLGGGDWAILPDNLFCDVCQNVFGSSIEQQALDDYPFSFFRVFMGIPTKKGHAPWMKSWEGIIRAAYVPGQIGYDPNDYFKESTVKGQKTQMRIIAHPKKPNMICRTLLKMGIEVVAADNPKDAFHQKFDAARKYALKGQKDTEWWYLQIENHDDAPKFLMKGVSFKEWHQNIKLEVVTIENDAEIFHLKLLFFDFLTPVTSNIQAPELSEISEPEQRLFIV